MASGEPVARAAGHDDGRAARRAVGGSRRLGRAARSVRVAWGARRRAGRLARWGVTFVVAGVWGWGVLWLVLGASGGAGALAGALVAGGGSLGLLPVHCAPRERAPGICQRGLRGVLGLLRGAPGVRGGRDVRGAGGEDPGAGPA